MTDLTLKQKGRSGAAMALIFSGLILLPACTAETNFKSIPSNFEPKATRPATGQPTPESPSVTVPDQKPRDLPQSSLPTAKPTAVTAVNPQAGATSQRSVAARPSPIAKPGDLAGRTVEQVSALLGTPAFRRRDGTAEVWRYDGNVCFLDVFFYQEQGTARVKHAEVRRRAGAPKSDRDCIGDAVS